MKYSEIKPGAIVAEPSIDIGYYVSVLWLNRAKIVLSVLLVCCISIAICQNLEKKYKATSTLLIESSPAKAVSIEDVYGIESPSSEYFLTQFEILKSRELAERVITGLNLQSHEHFSVERGKKATILDAVGLPAGSPEVLSDDEVIKIITKTFFEGFSVTPVRDTQLVKVAFESPDAELSARIANGIAEEYIKMNLEAKVDATNQASEWVAGRLSILGERLIASEQKLQRYREEEGLVDVRGIQTLGAGELEQLTTRLVLVNQKRSEAETLVQQISKFESPPSVEQLMSVPAIFSHPLVQAARQEQVLADQKVVELSVHFSDTHPEMIAAKAGAKQAKETLYLQAMKSAEGIENEHERMIRTQALLEERISEAKSSYQGINRKEFKVRALERDVEANRHLYNIFLQRAKEIGEATGFPSTHARIIDFAISPRYPSKPNKRLIMLVSLVGAILLASVALLIVDYFKSVIRTEKDVVDKCGFSMIGFLPLLPKKMILPT